LARPNTIKSINQNRVLRLLRQRGVMSRADLARAAGLTRSTLTHIVNDLLLQGLVLETEDLITKQGGGRPGIGVTLNPDGACFLGAEIGVETVSAVAIDLAGHSVAHGKRSVPPNPAPDTALTILHELLDALVPTAAVDPARIRGIGVTVPGLLDADGNVLRAPNLGWHRVTFRSRLEGMFSLPVFVDNDANASALGEIYFGGHATRQSLVYLLLSTGVGGGIVINKRIYRGATGIAGEIGQVHVSPDGPPCAYGGRGCLEGYVGKNALLENYRRLGGGATGVEGFSAQAAAGETAACRALEQWAFWLSRGVMTLINIFNPDHVVIGGPLSVLWPHVRARVEAALESERIPGNEHVVLSQSLFGDNSCAIGAAALVFAAMFELEVDE
jgi:predicted NBD/HSP70 family sugar kinase